VKKKDSSTFMKILVRAPDSVSEQGMAYPFFHYLRELYPHAQITVVCSQETDEFQYRNLVDQVQVLSCAPSSVFWRGLIEGEEQAAQLKAQGPWDLGFILSSDFSAAWMFYRAGVKRRRGYRFAGRGLLLNEGMILDSKQVLHRAEEYVALLPAYEKKLPPVLEFWGGRSSRFLEGSQNEDEKDLFPEEGVLECFDVQRAWPSRVPLASPEPPFWVLAPQALESSRQWPEAYFEKLAESLFENTSLEGVILGAHPEEPWVKRLEQKFSDRLILVYSSPSVSAFWRILRESQFTICNDSEIAHVAALCGATTFVIWGAGRVAKSQPLGAGKVQILVNPVECWPCEEKVCEQSDPFQLQCLRGLHPEVIFEAVMKEIQNRAKP
jgi:heptosyltransferase II